MEISKDTVKYVADLARLELGQKELERLSKQLQDILNFIDQLKQEDVKEINPTSHILPLSNVLREDQPGKSLSFEKALENAPSRQQNFFVVPKIIE